MVVGSHVQTLRIQYEASEPVNITETKLIKIITDAMDTDWQSLCNAKGRDAKAKRGIAMRCFRHYLKYDYNKLSSIFGGIHPTNISRAMNRELKDYVWERMQIEIQNAKRKT